jgi:mannose-6-phosphate isomerase-like protein (cupin superfamily)
VEADRFHNAFDRTEAAAAKGLPTGLPQRCRQGSMTVRITGGSTMAKAATKARKTSAQQRKARPKAPARRLHKLQISHFNPKDFKTNGLRNYAQYRDLGFKEATYGMAVAHVIRLKGPCDPKVVSKLHTHEADFQMNYVLKGSITSEFEGHGTHTMKAGDAWLQPWGIKHKVLDYSDDCEVLEVVMPANFKTVDLEK